MTPAAASNRRWWLWLPLLALAAWLALFGDKSAEPDGLSLPTRRADTPAPAAAHAAPAPAPRPPGREAPAAAGEPWLTVVPRTVLLGDAPRRAPGAAAPPRDLFAGRDWRPPAPPPPAAPPPPVPQPPALPYQFLGKKLEAGTWEVYLGKGDETFLARRGAVLEKTYRVDAVAPPHLVLTYLPLGRTQTLPIGDAE